MGFGGRKFESPRATLQTQLREEDGRSLGKEERQNRRAKLCRTHRGFKLATGNKRTRMKGIAYLERCFLFTTDHAARSPPMKIFVVGGAGYIGSVCAELLLNEGHEVVIFDNLSEGHRGAVDSRTHFIEGELADRQQI